MKNMLRFITLTAVATAASILIFSGNAAAFNGSRIMDDVIFNNSGTMKSSDIDRFLNGFSGSCISQNNGFSAPDPVGYNPNQGFLWGGNVSAGTIIAHAAQAYDINPQVLLSTLQKEQSLVTGNQGCSTLRYAAAVGYGCPDGGTTYNYSGVNLYTVNGNNVTSVSGTCVNSSLKVGFSQQVIRGAWLLKFGEQRSEGNINWAVIKTTTTDNAGNSWNSNWNNSDDPQTNYGGPMTQGNYSRGPSYGTQYYDGYYTIDGSSIHLDTGTTASLYWYTPHFAGNQNFENIFEGWFGPTTTAGFSWQYISQNVYTDNTQSSQADFNNLVAGKRYYLTLTAKNTGSQTWQKGVVNLGTTWPTNRSSAFHDSTWLSGNRAATLDQASVAPGDTGTFSFWV
ncbi:MAG TPA: hypothetical protein VLG16_01275, partial [Candidatus Saccharimonadales bacterium]|nr:hypothetical protein [Candidatus Saccharimonadales bacterium]